MHRVFMHLISDYGLIRAEGPDALRFLQGQLSADLKAVQGQQGAMACDVNLKGRVMAAFYVYAVEGGYHIILPRDQVDYVLADLKKYAVFSKVTLTDISAEYSVYPQLSVAANPAPVRYHVITESQGLRFSLTDRASFLISKESADPCEAGAWFSYLIEHDIPTISAAARDLFLPHYIGLVDLGAVSFDKGCYKGQEVVARMHYRAKIKKFVGHCVLEGEQDLNPGETLAQGEVVNAYTYAGKTYLLLITPHTA